MPTNIKDWNPEDPKFWESTGKSIAYRNLLISVPSLLNGFAIWLMWGIIAVQMLNLGFPFSKEEMFTLTAISGLAGATLRIPASFFIRIAGGRNTIFLTTALLMIPAIGTGIALHAANDILFAEYSWVPAENQQAAMRCQHPEKKRSTFVRFVSLAGSIDESITEAVRRKTATIGQVFA
jgi:hypothetical protein